MDPAKMKVVDLRSELGALGLDTKGNKPALVERLKKALEAKTGKAVLDTTILDTSTEDVDEPATPRRSPAARATRRSSSSRICATPAKIPREDPPKPIQEEPKETAEEPEDKPEPVKPEPLPEPTPEPNQEIPMEEPIPEEKPAPTPEQAPEPVPQPIPEPVPEPIPEQVKEDEPSDNKEPKSDEMYNIDDLSQSPINENNDDEKEIIDDKDNDQQEEQEKDVENNEHGDEDEKNDMDERRELYLEHQREKELSEQEEWDQLNERLVQKEKERVEREKEEAEEEAKKMEEISKDPIKLQRLKRKQEKKSRWTNFYKAVEVTNQVLAPPTEEPPDSKQKEETETAVPEPELDDNKVTLSWYDSDLNQYLELPELNSVIPLNEGAFAYAWAGARATHGVTHGRLCYEVRVGSLVTSTESAEKEPLTTGLRVGWSTDDSSLHLGDNSLSWGYESTGRAVTNSEFKAYGKQFNEKDVIGCYLDLDSTPCQMSYTLNGEELGTAFEFDKEILEGRAIFPHVLTKNMCYKVNLGYDRYTMLTKTKIVRNRVEIPIEQVLEEKRIKEEKTKQNKEDETKITTEKSDNKNEEIQKNEENKDEIQEKNDKEGEMEVDQENDKENIKNEQEAEDKQEDTDMNKEGDDKQLNENGEKDEKVVTNEAMETNDTEAGSGNDENSEIQEVTEEQVMGGLVLDKRIKFVIRYTVEEELDGPELSILPGYEFIAKGDLVDGPRRPSSCGECEVILMVGMPGSGKTYWAKQHCAKNPEKRYNILSTGALFERMKVDCKSFRTSYEGKWDAMVTKCAKCVVKLLEIAKGRRRNFILDQTNVYPSAQRRKLREFTGYRRIAAVVVVSEDEQKQRAAAREAADGKEVPDAAILDMKANFTLPEKGSFVDEVIYTELNEEEARKVLETYHSEAAAAGALKERDKRARSTSRDTGKRQRSPDRREHRRPREHGRERDDRWSGGSRWGPPAPRGRWGRDRPPHPRFDRNWSQRNDFGRDGGFRGGRMGSRQDRGPGPNVGGPGPRGPPAERFQRDHRPPNRGPPHQQDKRPAGPPPGSWQRGSGPRGGGHMGHGPRQDNQNQNQNHNQNQNQQWNQWAGNWGGWGNWNNQNPGWNNWNNWCWGNQNPGQGQGQGQVQGQGQAGAGKGPAGQGQAGQGPAGQGQAGQGWQNYNAQQWFQWQQWQQQNWPGYGQQQQQQQPQGGANSGDNAQAWAQFYQNYGAGNNGNSNQALEKK
ncbi:unnamed protein product [Danaus chrysippus]|uniref:(African queen) hypothetical protein n=1 Tax=Danaus chrysippus TaxID=151541 RepID=A0A8J2QV56_9NEOP|nr:unnamed protein product [Danaus chrysippus]